MDIDGIYRKHYIFIPPQQVITCPVIYADKSEARNRAKLATSSGVPPRRRGICSAQAFFTSSGSALVISVMMKPGAMALWRILRTPISLAADLVKPMIPAFDAE